MTAAGIDDGADTIDVWGVMCERQLFPCRVASLDMNEGVKELRTLSQSPRNRSQPANMFRVAPPGVMSTAVGVGDERDRHE
jgi:hypothetical protein